MKEGETGLWSSVREPEEACVRDENKLTEKTQNLEVENATSGTRIESLKNWAKKLSEKLDKI